jgi:hypothetical protein
MEQQLLKRVEEANTLRTEALALEKSMMEFILDPSQTHVFLLKMIREHKFKWLLMNAEGPQQEFQIAFSKGNIMKDTDPSRVISFSEEDYKSKMEWRRKEVEQAKERFEEIQKLAKEQKESLWKQYESKDEDKILAASPLWKLKGCDGLADNVRTIIDFLRSKDLIFSWQKGFEKHVTIRFQIYSFTDSSVLNLGKRRVADYLGSLFFSTQPVKKVDWHCPTDCTSSNCYHSPSEGLVAPKWVFLRRYDTKEMTARTIEGGYLCGKSTQPFGQWLKKAFVNFVNTYKYGDKTTGMEPSLKEISTSVIAKVQEKTNATYDEALELEEATRAFEEATRALKEKQEALERVQKRKKVLVE